MKYFIMSDIHGSASACEKALNQFEAMKCDEIILLGDVLYHGPRNPLPDAYDPKAVCAMLNPLAGRIIACRGNCDSEVDQMVLKFPVLSDYTYVVDDGVRIFASHGHIYSPAAESEESPVVGGSKIPQLDGTAVELFGHIHVQLLYKTKAGITVCNPGSVSLPKNDSPAGFAVYGDRLITLFTMDGKEQKRLAVL
jgi:putative phosphoesterase